MDIPVKTVGLIPKISVHLFIDKREPKQIKSREIMVLERNLNKDTKTQTNPNCLDNDPKFSIIPEDDYG